MSDDSNYEELDLSTLYDLYAPAVLGFLLRNDLSREDSEEYLIEVFIIVNDEVDAFKSNDEYKLARILRIASGILNRDKKLSAKLIPKRRVNLISKGPTSCFY